MGNNGNRKVHIRKENFKDKKTLNEKAEINNKNVVISFLLATMRNLLDQMKEQLNYHQLQK